MGKKILHLTLKRKWFQMILSGEKKEEYREIKEYWIKRLISSFSFAYDCFVIDKTSIRIDTTKDLSVIQFKHFDIIRFTNGYGKNAPTFDIEFKGIRIGEGNPAWGGSGTTFIISLGKIIK